MDLENARPGEAFENDYPESYGNRAADLREIVARQTNDLGAVGLPREPELLGILRGRRCGRQDLTQIEVIPRDGGKAGSLVARGEIVMPVDSSAKQAVQAAAKAHGFDDVGERGGLRVFRRSGALSLRVDDVIDEFAVQGFTGWSNAVATMAAVGKGMGGPEPIEAPDVQPSPGGGRSQGPVVAVIDTGIIPENYRNDGWLDGVSRNIDNVDLLDVFPCGQDGYLDFQAGHGTFVAGIIQRVAHGASIKVYKAADSDGFATDADIAAALRQAYDDGARIINLSLGMRTPGDEAPAALADAVDYIRRTSKDEAVIVAAAGNFGDDQIPVWPAKFDGVDAVAGVTADLTGSSWSSRGDHVTFSAVAEGIRSTFVTGHESPVFDREPETFPKDAWALWSGTSFAAPQIAGAIARICQEKQMEPRAAAKRLAERGLPVPGFGRAMRILEGVR